MAGNVSVEAETETMEPERVERNHREVLKTPDDRREAAVERIRKARENAEGRGP